MKLSERIIMKTIDGKVEVRPKADKTNCTVEFDNVLLFLDDEGIEAWNNGEMVDWRHGVLMDKRCLDILRDWDGSMSCLKRVTKKPEIQDDLIVFTNIPYSD